MNMSLPPSDWTFEGLQAPQSIENSNSGQPQEEPPQISQKDEGHPDYPEDTNEGSTSSGEFSEEELRRMAEADGEEITEILTTFTKHLKVVEANTEKIAAHGHNLTENVATIAIASQHLDKKLAAVEASTTEIQTTMAALEERNKLHEIGTHNIRFNTQNMAKEAEKMGKEMELHQIAILKQHSTIFKGLHQINVRLDRFINGQPDARGALQEAARTAEPGFGNLSLATFSILAAFMLILALAAYKYYEIIQGS